MVPQLADTRLPVSAYLDKFVLPKNTTDSTNATHKCNTQIIQNTQMIHNRQKVHIIQGIYREIKQGIGNKLGWLAKKQPNLEKLVEKRDVVTHCKQTFSFYCKFSALPPCSKTNELFSHLFSYWKWLLPLLLVFSEPDFKAWAINLLRLSMVNMKYNFSQEIIPVLLLNWKNHPFWIRKDWPYQFFPGAHYASAVTSSLKRLPTHTLSGYLLKSKKSTS